MPIPIYQRTLARPVSCQGIGVHSGHPVNLTIHPAPCNHGIKFVRTDLPDCPSIAAHFNMVVDTSLATVIGYGGFIVSTIEHLMASFYGLAIDNALVEVDAYEMPIMDGSAEPFTRLLKSAGMVEQTARRCVFVITSPIELKADDKWVALYPAPVFRITCDIAYNHPLIGNQQLSVEVSHDTFDQDLSRARTFGFFQEVEMLRRFGLARGGTLDNAIVIDQQGILNDGGLRYPDEFVRHKILDCIGDFSLLGLPILGHLVVHKSGHAFNHAFLKQFFSQKAAWETRLLHGE